MKKLLILVAVVAGALCVNAKKKKVEAPVAPAVELKSGIDSISYAAGYAQTNGLIPFLQQQHGVDTAYIADFIQGMKDAKEKANDPRFIAYQAGGAIAKMFQDRFVPGISGELKEVGDSLNADLYYAGFFASLEKDTTLYTQSVAEQAFQSKMNSIQESRRAKAKAEAEANKAKGAAWLAENAKKEGVVTLPSGLQYKVITEGTGAKPTAEDEVTVKYEGKLIDGTVFDSSYKRNQPATFKCNQVIKGWTEALQLMSVGSKWELYIPQDLAYGEHAQGSIPAYSTLIFTVELDEVKGKEAPAAASATAKKPAPKKKTKK